MSPTVARQPARRESTLWGSILWGPTPSDYRFRIWKCTYSLWGLRYGGLRSGGYSLGAYFLGLPISDLEVHLLALWVYILRVYTLGVYFLGGLLSRVTDFGFGDASVYILKIDSLGVDFGSEGLGGLGGWEVGVSEMLGGWGVWGVGGCVRKENL